jgi:hypothetical protein
MAGYSGTPLQKKLGLKEGQHIYTFQPVKIYKGDEVSPD